jgi:4-diphosphocytidyl-2C-methyl-D-erythritol kinase
MAASLGLLREVLETSTARAWLMSGSGPTLFAVYPSVEAAAEAGRSMAETRSSHLENAYIHAVDLVGPDPAWRYP